MYDFISFFPIGALSHSGDTENPKFMFADGEADNSPRAESLAITAGDGTGGSTFSRPTIFRRQYK